MISRFSTMLYVLSDTLGSSTLFQGLTTLRYLFSKGRDGPLLTRDTGRFPEELVQINGI